MNTQMQIHNMAIAYLIRKILETGATKEGVKNYGEDDYDDVRNKYKK